MRMGYKQSVGAGTAVTVGTTLMSIAPYLAYIPVVGWIGVVAGEVIGLALVLFGNKWNESTGVRWLTAYFEWGALGDPTVISDNHIHEQNVPNCVKWFYAVLGVPCYDRYRFAALRGFNAETGALLGNTIEQRAGAYVQFPEVAQAGVTLAQAMEAATIASTMLWPMTGAPGCWAQMTAAPSLIATPQTEAAGTPVVTSTSIFLGRNKWYLLGGAGLLLWWWYPDKK